MFAALFSAVGAIALTIAVLAVVGLILWLKSPDLVRKLLGMAPKDVPLIQRVPAASSVDRSQESIWTRAQAACAGFSSRWGRGLGWLAIGIGGALIIGYLEPWGVPAYTARWLGSLFKAATAAWGAYRISKGICSIDPSMAETPQERGMLHLARAIIVGGTIIAVLMAV